MENLTAFADYLLTVYLLRSSLILAVLLVIYFMVFSKEVTFLYNRIYLVTTMVLTLFLPLIELPMYPVYMQMGVKTTDTIYIPKEQIFTNYQYFLLMLALIYLTGVVVMMSKFIYHIYLVINKIRNSAFILDGNYRLVMDTKGSIASFFHYIFVNNTDIPKGIIDHEKIHAKQLHSIDILLTEIIKCMFWFHPFAYILTNHIKLNHEYFCDAAMVQRYGLATYADCILNYRKDQKRYSLCNHFFSFTKKRITMMNILKNNPKRSQKYLLMIPILLSVFSFFSFKSYVVPVENDFSISQDSIPLEEFDTIITMNLTTYEETIRVVKRNKSEPVDIEKILKLYPNIITYSDTSFLFNPETYEEIITITTRQILEGYKVLIDLELKKSNPNYDLINKWQKQGEVK